MVGINGVWLESGLASINGFWLEWFCSVLVLNSISGIAMVWFWHLWFGFVLVFCSVLLLSGILGFVLELLWITLH